MAKRKNNHSHFWLNTFYGQELSSVEIKQLSIYFRKIFGLNVIQIGNSNIDYLSGNCKINHKIIMVEHLEKLLPRDKDSNVVSVLCSKNEYIPLPTNSVDAVIIAHGLEFSSNAQAILREVDRILVADGQLIVLGFNPYSLWGLRSVLSSKKPRGKYPWNGKWLSSHRVMDWLDLLNYEILNKDYLYFKPCLNHQKFLNFMRFFEHIGKIIPRGSAVYCINARKKQEALIPLKIVWKDQAIISSSATEPTMKVK